MVEERKHGTFMQRKWATKGYSGLGEIKNERDKY
jgi:hypothetical protein